jgi:hypothetical protein
MICPGPEQAAAYADGRLDAAESARYLEHCSDCDDCRRTLAVLSQPRDAAGVPADVEARAIAALRRAIGSDRDRTPRPMRRVIAPSRPQRTSPVGFVIAASLLAGFAGLVLMAKQPPVRMPEPREIVHRDPAPEPTPQRDIPAPSVPQVPRQEAAPRPETAELPKPAPQKAEEPKFETPPEAVVREVPKPEETRPEDPPRAPSHTVVTRALSELQITDITGTLSVHRKGAKAKERLTGVARLGEGDILSAEKSASFQVEGRHPVVLSENTQVSMAYVALEQAPWLRLHSGEAMVDSTGSARWVVTDGVIAVAVKPARARFTAARGDARLTLSSLSEPLYVQPDGGQVRAIHPGEEFQVGKSSAEVRPLDAAVAAKKNAAFDAARPKTRTIFYTSCDPADAKREHFFMQEGSWYKNEALYSHDRDRERSAVAAIGPNPRFSWRGSLVLKFRVLTNCKSVEAQMRVDEKKYTLWKVVNFDRKTRDQWVSVEIPLEILPSPQPPNWLFRRDDGGNMLTVTTEDKFDSIRFIVRQSEVYGDSKPWVLIDDIQVVDKE